MTLSPAQQHLLNAAVAAFAERGYGGTSTRDIAARAGRSTAAVYVHHQSKEDLLYAISLHGHRDALAHLQEAFMRSSEPEERLRDMVFLFSLWHLDNAQLARVIQYEFHALSDVHRDAIASLRRQIAELMIRALRAGVDTGAFDVIDATGVANALLSLGIDLARWFDPERTADRESIARLNADLAVRMVRRSTPGEGSCE